MNARRSHLYRRASLAAVCSGLLLTGCQEGGKLASFSAGDGGKTPVALPSICEAFLQPVPVPRETPKSDAIAAYPRAADERDQANDRLIVGGYCVRDERASYAGPKEKPK